jgi:CRP-like cAMP-binding protein/uncharacterized membrane protein YdbT with pleckstrin-like domain
MRARNLTPQEQGELVDKLQHAGRPLPISEEEIRELAGRAHIREVLRGEIVIQQGAPSTEFYFIMSGQLRTADLSGMQPRLLNYHAAGTFVGERGLLDDPPRARSATIDAISDAKLAFWDLETMTWLLKLNDQVRPYFEELHRHRAVRLEKSFPGQQPDEVVVVYYGKHPVLLLSSLSGPTFLMLVGVGLMALGLSLGEVAPEVVLAVAVGLPLFAALAWGIYNFIDWRNDEYIVTSKRIIHIERFPLYGETWDEAPLVRIQDITIVAHTIWERLLNYHDLIIKTAGAGNIEFAGLVNAREVQQIIFEERDKAQERRAAADKASIRSALARRMELPLSEADLPEETIAPLGVFKRRRAALRLPPVLDYLLPRMTVIAGDTIVWRKHWFVLVEKVWLAVLLVLVTLGMTIFTLVNELWIPALLLGITTLGAVFWYVYCYDDWHRDVYIVTTDRIVDVESSAFRLRGESRREGTFDVIQNTTYDIPGFFAGLLNMGTVTIETAATTGIFTFHHVLNPSGVQQEIFNRMVAYQEKRRQQEREREEKKMAEWFGEYYHLHGTRPSGPPAGNP